MRDLLELAGYVLIAVLVFHALTGMCSCTGPTSYVPPESAGQMWIDNPGDPDPLEECQHLVGPEGRCIVLSSTALADILVRWGVCVRELKALKGEE